MRKPGITQGLREKPHVHRPADVCIYCGKTPPAILTDEHSIPAGLDGGFIIPRASCVDCQKITQSFENDVLRKDLLAFRAHANMRTRKPKNRPKEFPIHTSASMSDAPLLVALEAHPFVLPLPRFPPPGILNSADPASSSLSYEMQLWGSPDQLAEVVAANGGRDVFLDATFHTASFMRMLAKIAHCFAWDHMGPDGFKSYLPPLILGTDPNLAHYIGQWEQLPVVPVDEKTRHSVVLSRATLDGVKTIFASVQLFVPYGATPYCVVVGEQAMASPATVAPGGAGEA